MKKLMAFVLALVCMLGMVGCGQQQGISEDNKNELKYGAPQEPSNGAIVGGEDEPLDIEGISQEEVEEIALKQCTVNYDYIITEFSHSEKRWYVSFWKGDEKEAGQAVWIDTEGTVIEVRYAKE